MIKFAFTGPESTGKSSMTISLAMQFSCPYVAEQSRSYLKKLDAPYDFDDVTKIAQQQAKIEDQTAQEYYARYLFCDTDMLVCKIWQEYRYGHCDPWVEQAFIQRHYDLFFLCDVDTPWIYDPLREHPQPEQRQELFNLYKKILTDYEKPFVVLSGSITERINKATAEIIKR